MLRSRYSIRIASSVLVALLVACSHAWAEKRHFKHLNLNAAMLRINSRLNRDLKQRLAVLAPVIAHQQPDVVTLQEMWGSDYRERVGAPLQMIHRYNFESAEHRVPWVSPAWGLTAAIGAVALGMGAAGKLAGPINRRTFLRRSAYTVSTIAAGLTVASLYGCWVASDWGSGLHTISRHRIVDADHHEFSKDPRQTLSRPDEIFVHKGILRSTIAVPGLGNVDVNNAHMGARSFHHGRYEEVSDKRNLRHVREAARWMETRAQALPAIEGHSQQVLLGLDLNRNPVVVEGGKWTETVDPGYARLLALGLKDTHRVVYPEPDAPPAYTGGTGHPGHSRFGESPQEEIDFIFVGGDRLVPVSSEAVFGAPLAQHPRVAELEKLVLPDKLPRYLSDHLGKEVVFVYDSAL